MKVTFWQQFSSNHSASFMVVGKFKTATMATHAAQVTRDIIQQIGDFYRSQYDRDIFYSKLANDNLLELSEIEKSIKAKYELQKWSHGLDWTFEEGQSSVKQYENLLFVEAGETWTAHPPFDELFKKLGATVAFSLEGIQQAFISVTCKAPSDEVAKRIYEQLYDESQDSFGVTPIINLPAPTPPMIGEIKQKGSRLEFSEIPSDWGDTITWLTVLINYLKQNLCADIDYILIEQKPTY